MFSIETAFNCAATGHGRVSLFVLVLMMLAIDDDRQREERRRKRQAFTLAPRVPTPRFAPRPF